MLIWKLSHSRWVSLQKHCSERQDDAMTWMCKIEISATVEMKRARTWCETVKRNTKSLFSGNDACRNFLLLRWTHDVSVTEWVSEWALFTNADLRTEQPIDCTLYTIYLREQSLAVFIFTSSLFVPLLCSIFLTLDELCDKNRNYTVLRTAPSPE